MWQLTSLNTHFGGLKPKGTGIYDLETASREMKGQVRIFLEEWECEEEPNRIHVPSDHEQVRLLHKEMARPPWPDALTPEQLPRVGRWETLLTTSFEILDKKIVPLRNVFGEARNKALAVKVLTPHGPTWVIAVHLTTRLLPLGSAYQLRAMTRNLPEGPMVIAGDHNLWRTVAKPILGKEWHMPLEGGTWPADKPRHHIDHIWLRGLTGEGKILPGVGSDHLPVTVSDIRPS